VNPLNRVSGRRANRLGRTFQDRLKGMHAIYAMENKAIIDEQHPHVFGVNGKLRYAGRARLDFLGTLSPSGRSVALEAKSNAAKEDGKVCTSLPITEEKGGIQRDQIEELAKRGRVGAVALILWWNGDRLGWCDWHTAEQVARGRSSIPVSAFTWLEPFEMDWLGSWGKMCGRMGENGSEK